MGFKIYIYIFNSGDLVVRPITSDGMVESSLYMGKSEDLSTLSMVGDFPGVVGRAGAKIPRMTFENFFPSNNVNSVLYVDFFDNVIREVSKERFFEKYKIVLDDDIWTNKGDIEQIDNMGGDELFYFLNKNNKGVIFDHIYENNERLIVSFMRINKRYYIIYDKNTGEVKSGFVNFEKGNHLILKYFLGFGNNGEFIFFHNAEEFEIFAKQVKNRTTQSDEGDYVYNLAVNALEDIDEYCSTVLVYAKLK